MADNEEAFTKVKRGRPQQTVSLGNIYEEAKTLSIIDRMKLYEFIKELKLKAELEKLKVADEEEENHENFV